MDIVDKPLGTDGEVKVIQKDGVLALEADLATPILVGKLTLGIQETAIFDAIEKKYPHPLVIASLEMLKGVLKSVG
jgi:hypothetical protein